MWVGKGAGVKGGRPHWGVIWESGTDRQAQVEQWYWASLTAGIEEAMVGNQAQLMKSVSVCVVGVGMKNCTM